MKFALLLLTLAFSTTEAPCFGQSTFIAGHSGSVDPTTEGFDLIRKGNPSCLPVLGDGGFDGWGIGLSNAADIATYYLFLAPQQQVEAVTYGWAISLTLRVVPPFGSPTYGTFASLYTGEEFFAVKFGASLAGEPAVELNSVRYALSGAGAGYHNYQLLYDPSSRLVGLWFDGTHIADALGRPTSHAAEFAWGGGPHPSVSSFANWNEASLRIVPEPQALPLFILGSALGITALRRREPNRRRLSGSLRR